MAQELIFAYVNAVEPPVQRLTVYLGCFLLCMAELRLVPPRVDFLLATFIEAAAEVKMPVAEAATEDEGAFDLAAMEDFLQEATSLDAGFTEDLAKDLALPSDFGLASDLDFRDVAFIGWLPKESAFLLFPVVILICSWFLDLQKVQKRIINRRMKRTKMRTPMRMNPRVPLSVEEWQLVITGY